MKGQKEKTTAELIKEIQAYLHEKGIDVTETAITKASILIACRLGAEYWTYVCEFWDQRNRRPMLRRPMRQKKGLRGNENRNRYV